MRADEPQTAGAGAEQTFSVGSYMSRQARVSPFDAGTRAFVDSNACGEGGRELPQKAMQMELDPGSTRRHGRY